jgi:prepilin-type N-terminal cleavage/methylation domain-containing protein
MTISGTNQGFSLMEMMIAVFLSTILTTGIVQLVSGSVSAYRLQLSQSHLEESSRYARDVLKSHIAQAGFQPEPWQNQSQIPSLTDETLNGDSLPGDQLGLQRWSRKNCYGNENPFTDSDGKPAFYLLQTRFHVNAGNNLAITCRYGPDVSLLKTQINSFGLVEGVEAMQVLYAEDRNGDNYADRWVTGQAWQQESDILAIKVGLMFSTQQVFDQPASAQTTLLDETITIPADGFLRRFSTFTVALRGRL